MPAKRTRLDQLLHARGLVESREQGRRLIMAGEVLVNGQLVDRPAANIDPDAEITLKARPRFVSRGGEKLLAAITAFNLDPTGLTCADVGASTGGFTDCLLQHGAAHVFAIDVGRGILHWKLRNDPRVTVLEATNARFLDTLSRPVDLVTCDASFISLRILLPVMAGWLAGGGALVVLVKPQFEVGPEQVGKRGVVREPRLHAQALRDVLGFATTIGLHTTHLTVSPLKGPKGNTEFLARLVPHPAPALNDHLIRTTTGLSA